MPQLAKLIREKHPGSYDNVDDATLEKAVLEKYPQYASLVEPEKVEVDPVIAAKETLAKAPTAFTNSVLRNDIKPVITQSDDIREQVEPTTFWGGFNKSLKDQFLQATVGNSALQGAAHPQSLSDVAGLLLPSGVPQISKLIPRAKKVEEKVASVVKAEPKVVKEPKIDIGKNKTSNTTTAAILDSKGREIAPPQELIPNRPEGPWDKNIPRDDDSILPIKKDVKVAKNELVVKPKNIIDEINFSDTGKDIVGKMGKSVEKPIDIRQKLEEIVNPAKEEIAKFGGKKKVDPYLAKLQEENERLGYSHPEGTKEAARLDELSNKATNGQITAEELEEAKRLTRRLPRNIDDAPIVPVRKQSFADQVETISAPPDFTAPSFSSRREPLPINNVSENINPSTGELLDDTIHPLNNSDETVELAAGADLTKFDKILNFGGTMKSLMSGPDLSGLRQGFPLIGTPEYWKSIKPMVQAARSEGNFAKIQEAIKTRPNAQPSIMQGKSMVSKYKAGGLKLTDLGERLSGREEEIMSHAPEDLRNAFKDSNNPLAKGIRGVGNVYRGSNRAFTAYMNNLRATRFDKLVDLAAKGGHDINDPVFLKQIGTYINNATGRGSFGNYEGAAKLLNTVAFSPKLAMSRLHFINPMTYVQQNPIARKEAWKSAAAMAGFLVGTGELANFTTGAKFELDPRSADFGKIRIGNTRIDMGGGFLPYIRLLAQLATQSKVNSETGKVTKFKTSKYDNASTMDTLGTFGRTKESPLLSLVHDWATGEDFKGDPFQYNEGVAKRVTPMILQDILEVSKNNPELLPITIPASVFGAGVQSYDSRRRRKK